MKKKSSLFIGIAIMAIPLVFFLLLALNYNEHSYIRFASDDFEEALTYSLVALIYLVAFALISKVIEPDWVKWIFALVPTVLLPMRTLFYNSLAEYIYSTEIFRYLEPEYSGSYLIFVKRELLDGYGADKYKYILLFAAMYALCAAVILIQKFINGKFNKGFEPVCEISDSVEEKATESAEADE